MALSRSPIELAKKVLAIIGLRNAMSILFLERTSHTIKARSHSTRWKDHGKAVYLSVSQVLFNKRFEKGIALPLLCGRWFLSHSGGAYPHKGGNDV